MNWTILIYAVVYFAIGWWLADKCEEYDDLEKAMIFITWPLITAVILILALVYVVLTFIQWIIQTLTGGTPNGVV